MKFLILQLITTILLFGSQVKSQRDEGEQTDNSRPFCPRKFRCISPGQCRSDALKLVQFRPKQCSPPESGKRKICCPILEELGRPEQHSVPKKACGDSKSVSGELLREEHEPDERQWPWMMKLLSSEDMSFWGYKMSICKGFLVSKRHILTAAKCVKADKPYQYSIKKIYPEKNEDIEYNVTQIAVPSGYKSSSLNGNIAVITLAEEMVDTMPICLPATTQLRNLTGMDGLVPATIIRDKKSSESECSSGILSNYTCDEIFQKKFSSLFPNGFDEHFLCGMERQNCRLSAGTALMMREDGAWTAEGVMVKSTFGDEKVAQYPTIYSSVSSQLEWIRENIKESENNNTSETVGA